MHQRFIRVTVTNQLHGNRSILIELRSGIYTGKFH